MTKGLNIELQKRCKLISEKIHSFEEKIASYPPGRIRLSKRKNGVYFYYSEPGKPDRFLGSSEDELIAKLVQKRYLIKAVQTLKQELKAIGKMQEIYPQTVVEDLFDLLPEECQKYAKPVLMSDAEFARNWLATRYKKKPFKKGDPEFYTMRGERMRSKSEVIIAERLYANGIPYRYECPLKAGKRIIHPDFSILRLSDRKVIYHEHCGRMDNPVYVEDMVQRINDYNSEGILQGDRLFFSFETSDKPLDTRVIDNLINTCFR